jgi:hypothetical protein
MSKLDEIKERIRVYHYFNETEDAQNDLFYLVSKLEIAEKALEVAVKHIDGKAEKFSEREKIPVLYQLNEALRQLRS